MNIFLITRKLCVPVLLAVAIPPTSIAATREIWKTDCVGRSSVSLPYDVEVAAIPYDSFIEEVDRGNRQSVSYFKDGQQAGWSELSYFNGPYIVSNPLDAAQIEDLRSRFAQRPVRERERLKTPDTAKNRATVVPDIKPTSPQVLSWNFRSRILYIQRIGNHLLMTGITNDAETNVDSNEVFRSLVKNTSYREPFSIPSGNGVCLPYTFINDTGREHRQISISYRIKSQPDVMIVLSDESAFHDSIPGYSKTPATEINEFWTQYQVSRTGRGVSSRWPLSPRHTVKMDGRTGIASLVDITRIDGSKDIGYLAIVPGEPEAKTDVPTLRLFVVREANFARAKGIQPIDEKAFLELAEKIASSVQVRRP